MRFLFSLLLLLCSSSALAKSIVDITGQTVTIPDHPQRVILGESRMLYTLALVIPGNPVAPIAGWPGDMAKYDPQSWQQFTTLFPAIKAVPQLGAGALRDLNPERVLQLKPDLIILPRLAKRGAEEAHFRQLMQQVNIPVIYVDLRVDLLNNTVPSLKIFGEVFNQPQRAQAFIDFYQQHMRAVAARLATRQGAKTRVMLHLHLGRRDTCCTTVVNGNLGQLLAFAGGDNIAAGTVKGVFGEINPEQVLAQSPQVYIATGMADSNNNNMLQLGPEVTAAQAEASLQHLLAGQTVLSQLAAVKNHRAYGLWHNFYLSPWHVVAVEMFAKALYPQLFADLDPQHTLEQLFQRFLPLPVSGTFWSQLPQ
ncbi:ABC transporter substrate-binding protein [Pantoea sp. KPR_PJ]|uniref:ABC transporter substrate-binding protein n=1 Tax=Pantoea sp. KPR_PJ TaxID=2738375 RepID=UPI003527368C